MAALTDGSPTTYATPKATSPAIRPASKPLTRKSRAEIIAGSVAGEAEQVTPIMDPLMDSCPAEEGDRTLLGGDEVPSDQEEHRCEDQPRQHLAARKSWSRNCNRLGVDGL
jgi:hypothetical protein